MAELGVRFKPTEEQSLMGRQQGAREGLQQAIQMLSLRYPKVMGASSPVGDPSLLAGNGAPRMSGFNPDSAILQALIRALSGAGGMVSQPMGSPMGNTPGSRMGGPSRSMRVPNRSQQAPSFTPGIDPTSGPLPSGQITREWAPTSEPLRTVSGDPAGAAARSSRGYNSPMFNKSPWDTNRNFL